MNPEAAAHHYSGPALGFPHGDARLDLTDLYAFGKPGDDRKSILVMNVRPSVSLASREPTRSDPFAHEAIYEFKIDTDGDSVADIAYRPPLRRLASLREAVHTIWPLPHRPRRSGRRRPPETD